jgi:hypothetical protein
VALAYVTLIAAAVLACLLWPPVVGFTAQPVLGFGLVALGAAALLAPLPHAVLLYARIAAVVLLWSAIIWCVLSQVAPLSQPPGVVWPLRLLPLVIGVGLWGLLLLDATWQRRALAAVLLPTLCGLALVAWTAPAQTQWFSPQYIAVDSHGTVYISNSRSNVIRVFAPDGTLRAKLRPQVAKELGMPGLGFEQPNVTGEPDQLGLATPGTLGSGSTTSAGGGVGVREEAVNFRICGLALDKQDHLYVPDMRGHVLLRFKPDGHLDAKWPLSFDLAQSPGCIAIAGDIVYLLSDTNALLRYNLSGAPLPALLLPEALRGGLIAAPDGKALFATSQDRVLALDITTGTASILPIAVPLSGVAVYQPLLAQASGRLLVADATAARIDIYCGTGQPCGSLGAAGTMPGHFGNIAGVTQDSQGNLYVADARYALVQRLTPSGRATALYWSPDDDGTQPIR